MLVDSKCYEFEEANQNPNNTDASVNRDRDFEIRACRPNARTKSFSLIDRDGYTFKLDAGGNAQAAVLIRSAAKRTPLPVLVTGELAKDVLRVASISIAR